MYSNSCCSCSFEPEIIKICQSSHKMYSNKILNFQESTTILNACTKKSGNLLKAPHIYIYICRGKVKLETLKFKTDHPILPRNIDLVITKNICWIMDVAQKTLKYLNYAIKVNTFLEQENTCKIFGRFVNPIKNRNHPDN